MTLAHFSRDQRFFVLSMLRDLEDKSPEAWEFIKSKFPPPHGKILVSLIKQGQKEGKLIKVPTVTAMTLMMSCITFPNMMSAAWP